MNIGKLEKVSLREIWKNEARDFTGWLEENIEILNGSLDLSLSPIERQKRTGTFAADLLAEDNEGNQVIIECQLEKTDHDHLGKVLTYLANLDAKTAIWICSDPRPEHVKTVMWLNEFTPADVSFYLVKVEGIRIGESPPAPLFSVICAPSEVTKESGEEKKEHAERHKNQVEFWTRLLTKSKEKTELHTNISPSKRSWIGTGAGIAGLTYCYSVANNSVSAHLYIDRGKDSQEINRRIFDTLHAKKEEIETDFGESLDWECEDRRSCCIRWKCTEGGLMAEDRWDDLHDKMIDRMIKLDKALVNHIRRLNV